MNQVDPNRTVPSNHPTTDETKPVRLDSRDSPNHSQAVAGEGAPTVMKGTAHLPRTFPAETPCGHVTPGTDRQQHQGTTRSAGVSILQALTDLPAGAGFGSVGRPGRASTSRIRGDYPLVHGPLGSKLLIVHHGVTHLESVQVGAILIAGEPIPAGPDGGQNHGPGAGEGVQHHAGA